MMAGMLGGVLLYRPIFSTFLKDTNVQELIQDKTKLIANGNSKIKSDTIISPNAGLRIINHQEYNWTSNGIKFKEKRNDTLVMTKGGFTLYPPLSGLGGSGGASVNYDSLHFTPSPDMKPVFSNVSLSGSYYWKFVFLVWIMILLVTMVYGPIAAFLVEMFPTKIRYTSMSLPYHIGNGVFGGLVPFIGLLLTSTYKADPLVGLWYPIGVAAFCLVVGTIYLNNKIDKNIKD
jgi:hypothetical protein